MRTLLIAFFYANNSLTFGYTVTESELKCASIIQEIEDGHQVHLTDDNGQESPPLLFGFCVDPDRKVIAQ